MASTKAVVFVFCTLLCSTAGLKTTRATSFIAEDQRPTPDEHGEVFEGPGPDEHEDQRPAPDEHEEVFEGEIGHACSPGLDLEKTKCAMDANLPNNAREDTTLYVCDPDADGYFHGESGDFEPATLGTGGCHTYVFLPQKPPGCFKGQTCDACRHVKKALAAMVAHGKDEGICAEHAWAAGSDMREIEVGAPEGTEEKEFKEGRGCVWMPGICPMDDPKENEALRRAEDEESKEAYEAAMHSAAPLAAKAGPLATLLVAFAFLA